VTLLGAVAPEEARSHYHRADVFCLPSFAEGVPVVLMEAMSCGLPVVTTYITGIPELVTDGVEGHTVTPGRADLVAEALRKLSDPARRRAMGEAGRTKVEREFDIATVGPQLVAVFEALPGT
jgi:colanic acid/amylovoran biosynthesis glycosyltransferase